MLNTKVFNNIIKVLENNCKVCISNNYLLYYLSLKKCYQFKY